MADDGYDHEDVQRIIGISHRQLDEWDRQGFVKPSLTPTHGRGRKRVYSFRDLVALRTAKYFRDNRVPLKKLRKALNFIGKHFPEKENPLAEMVFLTDSKKILVFDPEARTLMDTLKGGQLLLSIPVGKFAAEVRGQILILFPDGSDTTSNHEGNNLEKSLEN